MAAASDGVARPMQDRAQHAADQRGERHERCRTAAGRRNERNVALLLRQLRRQLGIHQRTNDHVQHVEAGEHEAGEEGARVKLHHRHARGGAIQDEHDATAGSGCRGTRRRTPRLPRAWGHSPRLSIAGKASRPISVTTAPTMPVAVANSAQVSERRHGERGRAGRPPQAGSTGTAGRGYWRAR